MINDGTAVTYFEADSFSDCFIGDGFMEANDLDGKEIRVVVQVGNGTWYRKEGMRMEDIDIVENPPWSNLPYEDVPGLGYIRNLEVIG